MDTVKLQKYFTDCGILSRRAAESEISDGKVKVNGRVAYLGQRIDPSADVVEYRGRIIRPISGEKICIMLNKPRGFVTTLSDEKGRPTVLDLVSDAGRRLYPIGRLDMDSDGLLLLTDDGELANKLTHPRHEIPKIYRVTVSGTVDGEVLSLLRSPLEIDGYKILPVKTDLVFQSKDKRLCILEMRLFEGRNRQIRKMCELANLKVKQLSRVAIGDLTLGELPQGKWRMLTKEELDYIKNENNTNSKI